MISPCPLSKGYRIPDNLAWISLRIFFIYRIVLAGLFAALFFVKIGPALLGRHDAQLYSITSSAYLGTVVLNGIALYFKKPGYPFHAQTQIFIDLIALTLLMHACGGITSGLGILLAVSVAAGGILLGGVCAMLFAAMASLFVLTEAVYSDLTHAFETTGYTYAGMLGASFFTIALISYVLAKRAEQMDNLATQRAFAIAQLRELNEYIIRHMQSGIIIVGEGLTIRMLNESALRMFPAARRPENLFHLSKPLAEWYRHWLANPESEPVISPPETEKEIHVRITELNTGHGTFHMIVLEDTALRNQRLQQSKLASLGRLTAGIAHEIRNPLGAISHAAQLIAESPGLGEQDRRLMEIIRENSRRMNTMIEDILQLSRRAPSKREKIALAPWVEAYLEKFRQEHGDCADALLLRIGTEGMKISIDTAHLTQIVDNLCLNALKHGIGEEGKIIVKTSRRNGNPCIEVIDHGPGIEAKNVKHLFEPFFTTSPTGTGLGLFISRELAELNQAKLDYYSLPEGGSCFRLSLPDAENPVIEI